MGDTKKEYVVCPDEKGSINISEDVVAAIAVSAALEVDGVGQLAPASGGRSKKNAVKSVKLTIGDNSVIVDLQILVKYGQQINVRISGVTFSEDMAAGQ